MLRREKERGVNKLLFFDWNLFQRKTNEARKLSLAPPQQSGILPKNVNVTQAKFAVGDLTWPLVGIFSKWLHDQNIANGRRAGLWLKFNLMKLKWIWIQSGAICFAKIAEFHHFWGALLPKVAIFGYQWHFGCTNGNSETTFISRYKKSIISVQGLKAGAWKSTMSGGRKFSPKLPRMSQTLSLFMQSHTPPAGLPNSPQPCDTCAHCCRQHPVP